MSLGRLHSPAHRDSPLPGKDSSMKHCGLPSVHCEAWHDGSQGRGCRWCMRGGNKSRVQG